MNNREKSRKSQKKFCQFKKTNYLCIAFGKAKVQRPHDSVAQLVEQLTLNQWVESSSLSGVTKGSIRPKNSSENH